MVKVSASVNVGENTEGFIPSILVGQPTWGFREVEQTDDKKCGRDRLDTPWDTEGCARLVWIVGTTAVKRSTVLDEILDKDTLEYKSDYAQRKRDAKVYIYPGNCPLLKRDHATTNFLGGDFGLVNRDDRGGDTDAKTGDDTASHKHTDVLRSGLNSRNLSVFESEDIQANVSRKRSTYIAPIIQITPPIWIAYLRPTLSPRNPDANAPTSEPAGIAQVIPPCC